jgi:hypothetical protein
METLGIIGFIFGIAALAQVLQLKKTVDDLKKNIEDLTYLYL